jgi:hypothetical protein
MRSLRVFGVLLGVAACVLPALAQTASLSDPPAIPALANPPAPAGKLDAASLPAAEHGETLLRVASPGRFAISVHSSGGTALQLVDMLAGPSDVAGSAGSQDGRLDQLLDVGAYKLRLFSAKAAHGDVALTLAPFHDAAPPTALPPPGRLLTATLGDGEQRAFWLTVPKPADGVENVRIEAAGRALADLRLWRNGRELVDLPPEQRRIEPQAGHGMTDLRLVGTVEPGTYLAIAYGGPSMPWMDNDAAQPFFLRAGASPALAEGWTGGTVGPFGSEVFAWPATRGLLRLDLPAPAPATLTVGEASAEILKNSREPSARIAIPADGSGVVELQAASGQAYTLRMVGNLGFGQFGKPGTYFVAAIAAGAGGDEPPPSVLLERIEPPGATPKPPAIVASVLPKLGDNGGWHARFNLHGETGLLFQSETGGEVSVRSSGIDVTTLRDNGGVADLPPGVFVLDLRPKPGVVGIADLIVGKPGQTPALQAPLPPDPALPLGVVTVSQGERLRLLGTQGPGIGLALSARPVPVALAEGPLAVTLAAGATLSVPVEIAPGGRLGVSEAGVGDVAFDRTATDVVIPAADHPRTVVLAWRQDEAAPPPILPPPPADRTLAVQAGTPAFFDLARDEQRGFVLSVPQGGLYRIETTGRLHTAGRLATPFIASLGAADGNGVGQNMLIQSVLRAGRYRVDVQAKDSAGHLGLLVSPAPLLDGAALRPGGSVRASLPTGTGVRFPIDVAGESAAYRVRVDGLGAAWTGRLEDEEGWPLTAPGKLDGIEQSLPAGHYRLVVAPDVVARKVVARLVRLEKPVEIVGHGPHDLPFGKQLSATWREPDGRDQPRAPDLWRFGLAGTAHVRLRLGEGMMGELRRTGSDAPPIRIVDAYKGELAAGDYVLAATSLGRNDRLGYSVRLDSDEIQPDAPRRVTLPAEVPFSIAQPRVVSLTSFGTTPLRAELRREDGSVVARYGAREDDWNIAVSRLLSAGRYRLALASAAPPDEHAVERSNQPEISKTANGDDRDAQPQGDDMQNSQSDSNPSADNGDNSPTVSLRLALPDALPAQPAPVTAAELAGQGVHVLDVAQPPAGSLLVAQALSPAALVLALERQEQSGWQTVAIAGGSTPVVASPADGDARPWRVEVWTVDGGPEPIRIAARAVAMDAQAEGALHLSAQEGMPGGLAIGHVKASASGPLRVANAPEGLLVGGWAGHALASLDGDTAMLPGNEAWLIANAPAEVAARSRELPAGEAITLALPEGLATALPQSAAAPSHVLLWRVESGLGQPGLGGAMGVAASSALALGGENVVLRNAGDAEALRVRLTRLEPALDAEIVPTAPLHVVLKPGSALPVSLPDGAKRVSFDLAPSTAGIAGWNAPGGVVAWAGNAPLSRDVAGNWRDVLLVNTGAQPAPVSLSWETVPASAFWRPGSLVKRFFGAAGSFEAGFDAPPGARMQTAGDADLTAIFADGSVRRGRNLALAGLGRVIVRHGVGAMAVWIETDAQSPWPDAPVQNVTAPAHLDLSGPAMALGLSQDKPMLLHVVTTSPVLIGLQQEGRSDPPALFAAGASFHRVIAAGPAELRLYAPQDGPLSGSLDLAAEPIIPIGEGLGEKASVASGGSAVFGFTLAQKATIGVGVRADPDRASVRLLDASGKIIGEGVAQLRTLAAGDYLIEAQIPPDAPPSVLRPAVVGITPRGNGPPPDVAAHYLELVGMKLQGDTK